MRETQRRRLLYRAHKRAQSELKAEVLRLLERRFKALKRELRRANLRKRLKKTDGVFQKVDSGWPAWAEDFSSEFQSALLGIVELFASIENDYFESHGEPRAPLDYSAVINDYHDRIGRKIKDIAEETLLLSQDKIRDWYGTDKSLRELIDELASIFGESRAETIARTEAGFVRSQVAYEMMRHHGIGKWIWDSALEDRTCSFCSGKHGLVFDLVDAMPPDASHPNCLCGIVYANDDGSELIYG